MGPCGFFPCPLIGLSGSFNIDVNDPGEVAQKPLMRINVVDACFTGHGQEAKKPCDGCL